MVQIRSRLDVADNTGARMATMIGVIGKQTRFAGIGDGPVVGVQVPLRGPRHGPARQDHRDLIERYRFLSPGGQVYLIDGLCRRENQERARDRTG